MVDVCIDSKRPQRLTIATLSPPRCSVNRIVVVGCIRHHVDRKFVKKVSVVLCEYSRIRYWKNSDLGEEARRLLGTPSSSLVGCGLEGLGCSVCVAVTAAQRGSERHAVPSTLLCRWNTPLPRVDGEDHGER